MAANGDVSPGVEQIVVDTAAEDPDSDTVAAMRPDSLEVDEDLIEMTEKSPLTESCSPLAEEGSPLAEVCSPLIIVRSPLTDVCSPLIKVC